MNRVPTKSETTAVIRKFDKAVLKMPGRTGIFVFSEMSSITESISCFDKVIELISILPLLLTRTYFPGPGTSMLKTAGSVKTCESFPKFIFPFVSVAGPAWGIGSSCIGLFCGEAE